MITLHKISYKDHVNIPSVAGGDMAEFLEKNKIEYKMYGSDDMPDSWGQTCDYFNMYKIGRGVTAVETEIDPSDIFEVAKKFHTEGAESVIADTVEII